MAPIYPGQQKRPSFLLLLLYILFGLYLLNYSFSLIPIPTFISHLDKWIISIVGFLLIISGITHLGKISRGY